MEMSIDYWNIHENIQPSTDVHLLPAYFEGQFIHDILIPVGRYYQQGALVCADSFMKYFYHERVTNWLQKRGFLKPYELAGYPFYHDTYVEFRRWVPERLKKYPILIQSIRGGFENMLAKKRVHVICRHIPEDCEQIIKEFIQPVPRNKAYH